MEMVAIKSYDWVTFIYTCSKYMHASLEEFVCEYHEEAGVFNVRDLIKRILACNLQHKYRICTP